MVEDNLEKTLSGEQRYVAWNFKADFEQNGNVLLFQDGTMFCLSNRPNLFGDIHNPNGIPECKLFESWLIEKRIKLANTGS